MQKKLQLKVLILETTDKLPLFMHQGEIQSGEGDVTVCKRRDASFIKKS
jgi:hypothetical protein